MKRMILFFALAVLFTACAGYKIQTDNRIGVGGEDKDGNAFFCVYDQKVEKDKYDMNTTCSMTVQTPSGVFECEKLSLSKISKDFKIETDCRMIIDLKKQE